MVLQSHFDILNQIKENNNKPWFTEHKNEFKIQENLIKLFFNQVYTELQKHDSLEKIQIFRIYKDVRFSKDKTPYKTHFSTGFVRTKPHLRGGYYLHIEDNASFIGGGFWNPNPDDLLRIRKEFESDTTEIRKIINDRTFINQFNSLSGDELKIAPKGFDKNHPDIDLIRKKQFLISKKLSNQEILDENLITVVIDTFTAMRPFFDYMSEVLATDLNGESLY